MTKKDFAVMVCEMVSKRMGEEYNVTQKQVTKNNNVHMQAILIGRTEQNITPTIYLEAFYESYKQGEPLESVIDRICALYWRSLPEELPDLEYYRDFSQVRERIVYKLINAQRNEKLLQSIPHICFLDLAICFCYAFSHQYMGEGTILITDDQAGAWGTNTADLQRLAERNTVTLYGKELILMEDLLEELVKEKQPADISCMREVPMRRIPMRGIPVWILSNQKRQYGAAAMLYQGELEEISGNVVSDLYILPSSVHEVLILSVKSGMDSKFLQEMVREINATQILPEEFLSDHIYYYSREEKRVTIVEND